jgi:hypothetical protein
MISKIINFVEMTDREKLKLKMISRKSKIWQTQQLYRPTISPEFENLLGTAQFSFIYSLYHKTICYLNTFRIFSILSSWSYLKYKQIKLA